MNNTLFIQITVDQSILPEGNYYVLDKFPFPCFVHNEDCIPICFKTYSEAAYEAAQCQDGHIIAL